MCDLYISMERLIPQLTFDGRIEVYNQQKPTINLLARMWREEEKRMIEREDGFDRRRGWGRTSHAKSGTDRRKPSKMTGNW